jgi:hypothetical protein
MNRKKLTARDMGLILITLMVGSAFLSPFLSQAQQEEQRVKCIANISQLAKGLFAYTIEWEGKYPLAQRPNGTVGWRLFHPADWSPEGTLAWEFPHHWRATQTVTRWIENATGWINAVQKNIENINIADCPAGEEVLRPVGNEYEEPRQRPGVVSYTYNGNLHAFSDSGIVNPGDFPIIWESHGKARIRGFAISNPVLNCENVPNCVYGASHIPYPGNIMYGTSSALSNPGRSLWAHTSGDIKGLIVANSQGNALFWRVGQVITNEGNGCHRSPGEGRRGPPFTNPDRDPFTGYWEDGCAGYFWMESLRGYAWLFRPDYDFLEEGNSGNLTISDPLR